MIVLDMEILQSAEETGGKIGNPTPYKIESMVPLCTCMKLEAVKKQDFWVAYSVMPKCGHPFKKESFNVFFN